ncbi:alpha/beta hydrolase [Streptomyces piniterrae]|uniref:alpha/beta hydrolase n=1 Tax=Streptomyces piniterrae TaxID=2571125 RepID=UPI001FEC4B2F|nr:alpha/beta hydrolase [Streptomyces piniterrae]
MRRRRAVTAGWGVATAAVAAGVAAVVLPATAGASAGAGTAGVPARYADQRLAWRACADAPSLECAAMTVPRDWHRPDAGEDLTVEVSRHRATDPARRRGVLMMAAGGPGASGLTRPKGFAERSPELAAVYDVVGFDQRGVGRSTPLRCVTDAEFRDFFAHDFRDRSPAAIRGVLDRSRQLARHCASRSGDLLPYLTTDQAVRDMDLYRSLLGAPKLSYYGPSYATMLGAYYATEFPRRVDRFVLDSNIAFGGSWQTFEEGQPMSFQRRFEKDFLPWLAQNDAVYHYGRTPAQVQARWERRRAALRERPIRFGTSVLGPNQLDSGAIQAMYDAKAFPALAQGLAVLEHWDTASPQEKRAVQDGFTHYLSPDFLADFSAVTCNDTPWTRDLDHWIRRSAKDTADHPLMGARELAFAATCAAWPASDAPRVRVTGKGLPTTLMLNSRHDPATYYEGAITAHRALRGSRLVTADGGDHGLYRHGNACVDNAVDAFLLRGTPPARDTVCASGAAAGAGSGGRVSR